MIDPIPSAAEFNPTAQRRRGPGLALLTACLALVAGLALGAFGAWRWAEWRAVAQPAPVAAVAAAPTVATTPDLPAMAARETELAGQLAALEARTAQVGQVAGTAGGYATRAEDLLVAQAARRRIERGLPLGYLEPEVRQRFGATQPRAVAVLTQAARNPVTLEDLRLGLDTVGGELAYDGGTGLASGIERQLASLIILHRTGTPSPAPSERLDRMRRAVGRGQVEAALAEASGLPGATTRNGWIVAARGYVAIEHALDTIEAAALTVPSASVAPATPAIAASATP